MCKKSICLISIVLVLGLTTTVANADISDELVGYWPLNEGEGTTTCDLSGNGNDGTLNGGPIWADGKFGGALEFDGVDDNVDCGNPSILDFGTGDWTVSAWIKVAKTLPGDVTIFGKGGDHTSEALPGVRYQLMLDSDNYIHPVLDDDTNKFDPLGEIPVIDGQWHHVVMMRRDGTTLRVYVDGVEDMGVTNHGESTIPYTYNLSGTSKFHAYIGAITNASDPTGATREKLFAGTIDDVAVWNRALTFEEIIYLWNDGIGNQVNVSHPGQASDPYPADEEADVLRDVVLSWMPGEYAPAVNGHKVYFSENFNDVNDGIGGIIHDANSYTPPQLLDFGTTYYWRVDEVNAPPDSTIFEGEVWHFTTEPIGYAIGNITATASSSTVAKGPENTINGSGLNDSGLLHGKDGDYNMWLSSSEPDGAWIEYELDKAYKIDQMWVWNYNGVGLNVFYGLNNVTIEYSTDGTNYTILGTTHEFLIAPGADNYAHNTTVDFGGAVAKYVRITAKSNWSNGITNQYGLSEVRFFHIPMRARKPSPESGATNVDLDVTLSFRAGREAAQHDVYFSTDEQAVIDGTAPVTTVTEARHGPLSLDLGQTYYWRVDEVNEAETPSTWQGELWSFTTRQFLVVDDFESYNDLDPTDPKSNRIFNVWIDGYGVATNGSIVGYENAPFCERIIVHGGKQSMPFFYNNTSAAYSEAERTFTVGQNWTKAGSQTLVLFFHGTAGNTGQLYVKVNGSKVVYGGDAGDIAKPQWNQWNIDLATLNVNLQNVTKLSIGIDGNGASGTLYFDDIRLYRLAP